MTQRKQRVWTRRFLAGWGNKRRDEGNETQDESKNNSTDIAFVWCVFLSARCFAKPSGHFRPAAHKLAWKISASPLRATPAASAWYVPQLLLVATAERPRAQHVGERRAAAVFPSELTF